MMAVLVITTVRSCAFAVTAGSATATAPKAVKVCLNFGSDSGQVVARQHVRGAKILTSTHPDRTKLDADLLLRPNEGLTMLLV